MIPLWCQTLAGISASGGIVCFLWAESEHREMSSIYRQVDPKKWIDEKHRGMSDRARVLFDYFLTSHIRGPAPGIFVFSISHTASVFCRSKNAIKKAFNELFRLELFDFDDQTSVIKLKNALKYNPPLSPNHKKQYIESLEFIPNCKLKSDYIEELSKYFNETSNKPLVEGHNGNLTSKVDARTLPQQGTETGTELKERVKERKDFAISKKQDIARSTISKEYFRKLEKRNNERIEDYLERYDAEKVEILIRCLDGILSVYENDLVSPKKMIKLLKCADQWPTEKVLKAATDFERVKGWTTLKDPYAYFMGFIRGDGNFGKKKQLTSKDMDPIAWARS